MVTTYNTAELRRQNKNRVFKYIYTSEKPVTKQDIAQSLNLSLPTVGQNLRELQEEGLLELQGTFDSTGGRKPRAIGVCENALFSIGVMISLYHVHIVCINLRAKPISMTAVSLDFCDSDKYYKSLADAIETFIDEKHIEREHLMGVGIALPGIADRENDIISLSRTLSSKSIKISELTKYIKYPSFVENDANAGGISEWWNQPEHKNMAYLFVQRGVGGAVLLDGVRYMGHHNHSGEFGHMCIVPGGQRCLCGKRGCLEAYCSTARISTDLGISREEFFEGLATKEEYQKIWNDYLEHLAIGINNIHMVLDCDIILGGVLAQFMGPYLQNLREKVKNISSFDTDGEFLKLSRYLSWSTCIGVALHFVSDYIDKI